MALLTEEQQNVAVTALATTLGKPVSEIEATLSGDKPTEVDTLVSERLKAIRKEGENAGKGRLQKVANKLAKDLFNTETAEVETIEDLLNAVKEGYTPPVDPSKLTEEQVKAHQAYKTLESTLSTERTNHQTALEKATTEAKKEVDREKLRAMAVKARADFGAVFADDQKLANVQERMFLDQLEGVTIKTVDGKNEFWKADSEGNLKRIETDKLIPVSETDFLKGLVENIYTTKVSDQKDSTGLPPNPSGNGGDGNGQFTHFKGTPPKTLEEYNNILRDKKANTFDAREEVTKYWQAQQQPK